MAKILGRPVKFVADRLESFSSDITPATTGSRAASPS